MLDSADEARSRPLDGAREFAALESVAKLREGMAQFEPGEVRTQADVLADPEANVFVWHAIDAEGERIGEHVLVAVRRGSGVGVLLQARWAGG